MHAASVASWAVLSRWQRVRAYTLYVNSVAAGHTILRVDAAAPSPAVSDGAIYFRTEHHLVRIAAGCGADASASTR